MYERRKTPKKGEHQRSGRCRPGERGRRNRRGGRVETRGAPPIRYWGVAGGGGRPVLERCLGVFLLPGPLVDHGVGDAGHVGDEAAADKPEGPGHPVRQLGRLCACLLPRAGIYGYMYECMYVCIPWGGGSFELLPLLLSLLSLCLLAMPADLYCLRVPSRLGVFDRCFVCRAQQLIFTLISCRAIIANSRSPTCTPPSCFTSPAREVEDIWYCCTCVSGWHAPWRSNQNLLSVLMLPQSTPMGVFYLSFQLDPVGGKITRQQQRRFPRHLLNSLP